CLSDDLNTTTAIADLHSNLSVGFGGGGPNSLAAGLILLGFEGLVGKRWPATAAGIDNGAVAAAIFKRLEALNAKDFATADRIRAELLEQGIQLKDAKNEAGERVTT